MLKEIKPYLFPILLAIGSIVLYAMFGYDLVRSDFVKLISIYSGLFLLAYILIEKQKLNFWVLAGLGIVFRLISFGVLPNLSQDFYRFLWDGRLVVQRISPYLFTPEVFLNDPTSFPGIAIPQAQQLYEGMGLLNASHFSNYPPVNQFFFAIAALFAGKSILGSVMILKSIIILADMGILYFGKKLLERLNMPIKNIFWYFLNPFIIIELTGNLHFEGVMLFFVIWAMYLLSKGKWVWSAILIGLSVSVKLLPLMFLPLFWQFLNTRNSETNEEIEKNFKLNRKSILLIMAFAAICLVTVALTFAPFFSFEFLQNFMATISLWFQNFEFNASVYYLIRWIGFQVVGWNIIATVGKILPILVISFILILAIARNNSTLKSLLTAMLLAISFYFLLSTTVHPWYIATPLLLSVFTKYRFPIVWSFLVMLSYSAYGKDSFNENLWLVALEYLVVVIVAVWEIWNFRIENRL